MSIVATCPGLIARAAAKAVIPLLALLAGWPCAASAGGKLLATGGVMQVEGAAGGGLTPWALIGGLGTEDEIGVSAFATGVRVDDYRLDSSGVAVGLYDRVELSLAKHKFSLRGRVLPGNAIRQDVYAIKVKIAGDAVADQNSWMPQIAVGLQHKRNEDYAFIPRALGARSAQGTDYYASATKLHLGAVAGRNLLWNATVRATKANQLGLLGFGGDRRDSYSLRFEGSAAVFLHDSLAVGVEYRAKPDNLSAFREQAWRDVFLAWVPDKHVSVTLANVHLGEVAGLRQTGWYLSLQLSY